MNTIYKDFSFFVTKYPSHLAVIDEQRRLSYDELDRLAGTIATKLPKQALRIGIIMDHCVAMIASIFAVIKQGYAYIPVEPDSPIERIRYIMTDCAVDCIITEEKYAKYLEGFLLIFVEKNIQIEEKVTSPSKSSNETNLAYILYTSGTTGKPKGVAVSNANIRHYVKAFQNEFHPTQYDTMLQYSACSFDIFVEEVFTTLLSGASLAIPTTETKKDINKLMSFVEQHNITEISGFPYLLSELNELANIPKNVRLLISGGDVLRVNYIKNLIGKVAIYNTYGPSETTVCATYFRCNEKNHLEDGTYPIGTAVLGSRVLILDDDMNSVEKGKIGEICIIGGGVSNGYIGNSDHENKAFIILKNGDRLYRSGDLGYLLPDGNIAFLHRKDQQIMIYGKRVEPEEVENVLCGFHEIKQAVVKPYFDEQGLAYMIAYIVPKEKTFSLKAVKRKMSDYLASFMIPDFFVQLKEIPLTPNGKIDVKALPIVLK